MFKALQDFASANPAAFSAISAFASILVALAAVVISPVISFLTVRRQIRANPVSANRQAWINALRDELSELFEVLTWNFLLRPGTFGGEEGLKCVSEKRSRIRLLYNRIKLRLNPHEADSQTLLNLLDRLKGAANEDEDEFLD